MGVKKFMCKNPHQGLNSPYRDGDSKKFFLRNGNRGGDYAFHLQPTMLSSLSVRTKPGKTQRANKKDILHQLVTFRLMWLRETKNVLIISTYVHTECDLKRNQTKF